MALNAFWKRALALYTYNALAYTYTGKVQQSYNTYIGWSGPNGVYVLVVVWGGGGGDETGK